MSLRCIRQKTNLSISATALTMLVYRLTDTDNDGDAQDAGEATVWFSTDNAGGFSTITPNRIAEGGDGKDGVTMRCRAVIATTA